MVEQFAEVVGEVEEMIEFDEVAEVENGEDIVNYEAPV